jgi:hypothetical protein
MGLKPDDMAVVALASVDGVTRKQDLAVLLIEGRRGCVGVIRRVLT